MDFGTTLMKSAADMPQFALSKCSDNTVKHRHKYYKNTADANPSIMESEI